MGKMEGYFSTGQSPRQALVPVEEEEEEDVESKFLSNEYTILHTKNIIRLIEARRMR
jgi:hypothetical protein